MNRRSALKNLGLSLGYTVATPTLISIMQSCQSEKALEWVPEFFTPEEGNIMAKLVDIILPKTDTPSATEVQVHLFIDRFINEVVPKEEHDFTKMLLNGFIEKALANSGKSNATKLKEEDLEPLIASALTVTKEQEKQYGEALENYVEAIKAGNNATLDDNVAQYTFASNLRGMTIWGYKTSEYIGEEVLAYLPVPGEYIACESVDELTQGKAWSL